MSVALECCCYLVDIYHPLRQAKNADVFPGHWRIPASTILQLSVGAMMRYSTYNNIVGIVIFTVTVSVIVSIINRHHRQLLFLGVYNLNVQ